MRKYWATQSRERRSAILGAVAALTLLIPSMGISTHGTLVKLPNQIPNHKLAGALHLGHLSSDQQITLSVPIPPPNPAALDAYAKRVYDPGDPLFHQFLTTSQITEQFEVSQSAYDGIKQEFLNLGLNVAKDHAHRGLITIVDSVSHIESALQTRIDTYEDAEGKPFYSAVTDPVISQRLASQIGAIHGLHSALRPKPMLRRRRAEVAGDVTINSSPIAGGIAPSDIRAIYNLNSTGLTGSGQTIALFECDGFFEGDIQAYASQYGLSATFGSGGNISVETVDGATQTPSDCTTSATCDTSQGSVGVTEVELDMELALGLAPGAKFVVYVSPCNTDAQWTDLMNLIYEDDKAQTISLSWSEPEADVIADDPSLLQTENTLLTEMALKGQSFFVASGDNGAYNGDNINAATGAGTVGVGDPSSQPYATAVGGTTLLNQPSTSVIDSYMGEEAWGWCVQVSSQDTECAGSGGGNSQQWPTPSYQANLSTSANGGNSTHRMVPDVSLDADPDTGYNIYAGEQKWDIVAGTSAATPLWAAFTALVNQGRAAKGLSTIGFLNPLIYQLAEGSLYSTDMHDVTSGNNFKYNAVSGYDLATGWGSFNGGNLLTALEASGLPPSNPMNFHVTAVSP